MVSFACCGSTLATLSRAAAKAAAARLRQIGLLREFVDWPRRSTVCETCPLRIVYAGVSYCGRPFLQKIDREPTEDGCGCPTREKAKSPEEHCPLDWRNRAAKRLGDGCTCKWCNTYAA